MSHITDKYKETFVRVIDEQEFVRAQKAMFTMGFKVFCGHKLGEPRKLMDWNPMVKTLWITRDCEILQCSPTTTGSVTSLAQLEHDAGLYRMQRAAKKSASRKRARAKKAALKNNKTITHEDMFGKIAKDLGKEVASIPKEGYVAKLFETNPKKQYGDKGIPLHLWPALASSYGAVALYNGSLKYGRNNFKATPVDASIYIAAAKRHLEAWAEGEELDPVDGVPNLAGVLANIAILLEARAAGTLIDDRNIGTGYLKERDSLKSVVASLQELHKDKSPKHYTLNEVDNGTK